MDPNESLFSHQLGEPFLAHPQEEDVLALTGVRRQRLELLRTELARVNPGGDLVVREADLRSGLHGGWFRLLPVDSELPHDVPELLHRRARRRGQGDLLRTTGQSERG